MDKNRKNHAVIKAGKCFQFHFSNYELCYRLTLICKMTAKNYDDAEKTGVPKRERKAKKILVICNMM